MCPLTKTSITSSLSCVLSKSHYFSLLPLSQRIPLHSVANFRAPPELAFRSCHSVPQAPGRLAVHKQGRAQPRSAARQTHTTHASRICRPLQRLRSETRPVPPGRRTPRTPRAYAGRTSGSVVRPAQCPQADAHHARLAHMPAALAALPYDACSVFRVAQHACLVRMPAAPAAPL